MAGFKDLFIPRETAFFERLKKQVHLLELVSNELSVLTKPFTIKKLQTKKYASYPICQTRRCLSGLSDTRTSSNFHNANRPR